MPNLQALCDLNQYGFYFEEGGCWGMALALADHFISMGKNPTFRVSEQFVHAYVEVEGDYYDYTGKVYNPPSDLPPLTRFQFLVTAMKHGITKVDLLADYNAAKDLVAECDPLMEGVQPSYLFHGTDLASAINILRDDKLYSSSQYEHNPEGVSLTRDYRIARRAATWWERQFPVVLVLDRDKLKHHHKLLIRQDTDDQNVPRPNKEAEEMILGDLSNLSQYLVSINVAEQHIREAMTDRDYMEWQRGDHGYPWMNTDKSFREGIRMLAQHPLLNKWVPRVQWGATDKGHPDSQIPLEEVTGYHGTSQLTLWHGGRNLQSDYQEIRSHRKGRWEHGPGIYLTTHRDTAVKYAKGGGRVYRVTITIDPTKEISNVEINLESAVDFVNRFVTKRLRKAVIDDLKSSAARRGRLSAEVVMNLCLNHEAIANTKTDQLRRFLISHGVDYIEVKRYGGRDETVYVVVNPSIIDRVEYEKQSITEGLIKIPEGVLESAMKVVAHNVLSWADTKARGEDDYQIIDDLAEHHQVTLVGGYDIGERPVRVERLNLDQATIERYPEANSSEIFVAIDWRNYGKGILASWSPSKKAIIIYPLSGNSILGYWPRNSEALSDYFTEVRATLRHELRHMVQTVFLADHPEQSTKLYTDSLKQPKEYNLSPVEFDPTIGSEAETFVEFLNLLKERGKRVDVGSLIRIHVGMKKGDITMRASPFFTTLRDNDPRRYKIAVKKFVQEVTSLLKPLEESRRNPEINTQYRNKNMFDYLSKYMDGGEYFINFTSVAKTGINPTSSFSTPIGIYAYPLYEETVQLEFKEENLPFAGDRRYINVLTPTGNVLNFNDSHNWLQLIDDANELLFERISPLVDREFTSMERDRFRDAILDEMVKWDDAYPQEAYWKFTGAISQLLAAGDRLTQVIHALSSGKRINDLLNKIKWVDPQATGTWNHILRSLGWDAVVDNGWGIIHGNEPYQAVFLSSKGFKMIERVVNPAEGRTDSYLLDNPTSLKMVLNDLIKWKRLVPLNALIRALVTNNPYEHQSAIEFRFVPKASHNSLLIATLRKVIRDRIAGSKLARDAASWLTVNIAKDDIVEFIKNGKPLSTSAMYMMLVFKDLFGDNQAAIEHLHFVYFKDHDERFKDFINKIGLG